MPFIYDFSKFRTDSPQEYGRFQQHLALLEDEHRIKSFNAAIVASGSGKVVVDIGSGTGILAFLALKNGYEAAWLVEPSCKMIEYSRYLAVLNNLENQCHFIQATTETALLNNLIPSQIDLIVSETISSVIVGFGFWDTIVKLKARLSSTGTIIPSYGTLFAKLVSQDYATCKEDDGGLLFLKNHGINIDIFRHTFRSGGNIFQKWKANEEIEHGNGPIVNLLHYNYHSHFPLQYISDEVRFDGNYPTKFIGMVLFWDIHLSEDVNNILSVRDPRLTSWCPYYVGFSKALQIQPGELIGITMELLPIDSPFPYAFQFKNKGKHITEILYW